MEAGTKGFWYQVCCSAGNLCAGGSSPLAFAHLLMHAEAAPTKLSTRALGWQALEAEAPAALGLVPEQ